MGRDALLHGAGGGVLGAGGGAGHDGLGGLSGVGRAAEAGGALRLDCSDGSEGEGWIVSVMLDLLSGSARLFEVRGVASGVERRWSRAGVHVPATGARAARFMVMALMVSARTGAITTMVPGAGFPLGGSSLSRLPRG